MTVTRWISYIALTAIVSAVATAHAATTSPPVLLAVSDSLTNGGPTNWLAVLGDMRPDIRVVAEAHGGWTTKSYFKAKFDGVAWASLPKRVDVAVILLGSNNLFEDRGGSDASLQEAVDGVQKIEVYLRAKYPRMQVVLVAPPTCVPERWADRTKQCLETNARSPVPYPREHGPVTLVEPCKQHPTPLSERRIDEHSPEYLGKLSDAYRRLAARRKWEFVDLYSLLKSPDDFIDAAHPTQQANRKIADAIGQAVRKLLP